MKKVLVMLLAVVAVNSYAFKAGVEFSASPDNHVGFNLRLADQFELKPQLAFQLGANPGMSLIIDGNYIFLNTALQHYAGLGIILNVIDADRDNTSFFLNTHYGVRYDINEVVSIFGEVGLLWNFENDFWLRSTRPGLGVTFYIP